MCCHWHMQHHWEYSMLLACTFLSMYPSEKKHKICCGSMPAACQPVHYINAECGQRLLQVALRVTCVSSFPDVPHLQLSYSIQGQQVAHNLMLPIVVSKFCTPPDNPVPKDVFFSRWRAIAGKSLRQTQGA